jgi:AraC family transcriptional regulator of adaptative response/methylated-DNA-[protein]-cysteine methyltransferase
MRPSDYKAGGRGQTIRYATASSSFGRVLVAATERGVCAVALAATDAELLAELHSEYPEARLEAESGSLSRWTGEVIAAVDGRHAARDLPLDIRATAFQWQVWNALRDIPRGETRTYAQIAAAIGRPTAARAVARACAGNRVAVVIPCHRVVPAGGAAVGGYRWGAARKAALLQRERERREG